MDYTALLNEVTNDPETLGYAAFLPAAPGKVVDLLNNKTLQKPKTLMISERGVMAKYPGGPVAADTVLSKLETFTTVGHPLSSTLARVMKFLAQPEGIDIGSPASQSMIDTLSAGAVITADEGSKLKALANQPTSRAEFLGFGSVSEADLRSAGVI